VTGASLAAVFAVRAVLTWTAAPGPIVQALSLAAGGVVWSAGLLSLLAEPELESLRRALPDWCSAVGARVAGWAAARAR
jgi:hypothetical protein